MSQPANSYSRLDVALADFLSMRCGLEGNAKSQFKQLVLELSAAQQTGHSCLHVTAEQRALLSDSPLVSAGKENTPLVLEDTRLYLQRYWRYESRLVSHILPRMGQAAAPAQLDELLDKYFPPEAESTETDWQREAAAKAAQQTFSMITGGPGTGKTTTVLKILALLQELHQGELSIALAAPTGKAAMRLQQSLIGGKQGLPISESLRDSIPETVSTLHRLLGPINQSIHFRHNAKHPLPFDCLVVDEASMIDLALMGKLIDAISPNARLILLGDQDQLASVESGAVLSDLCASLPEHTLQLKKTYRFDGPIKELALAVNARQADQAWQLLQDESKPEINLVTQGVVSHMLTHYMNYIQQVRAYRSDPKLVSMTEAFEAFHAFQVLAAVRQGPHGVEGLNRELEKRLAAKGLETYRHWYHGRPVMITRNDPSLGLFNGDIGLCLYDQAVEQLQVWFEQSDGTHRAVMPGRLPEHETVYAMTIHKSQGSEFPHVMIVLPDQINPLLSGELLYTAITRAKAQVDIAATPPVFKYTVRQRVQRHSGLREKLSLR